MDKIDIKILTTWMNGGTTIEDIIKQWQELQDKKSKGIIETGNSSNNSSCQVDAGNGICTECENG